MQESMNSQTQAQKLHGASQAAEEAKPDEAVADGEEEGAEAGPSTTERITATGRRAAGAAAEGVSAATERLAPHVERGADAAWHALSTRRGLRIGLLGLALVLLGVLYLGGDSAWTVPLVVIGAVMILIGLLGPRLSGRFSLEWGAEGTVIEFRTEVTPPTPAPRILAPPFPFAPDPPQVPQKVPSAQVIEGEGETIEFDVAQLRALLAAERLDRDESPDRTEAEGTEQENEGAPSAKEATTSD